MELGEIPRRLRALPSYVLTLAAARAGQLALARATALGASKTTYGVLAVIDEVGPASQADLGRRLGLDRRSVSEEAVALERNGLVSRGPDPADSRRNRLELTPAGRALLDDLDRSFVAMQDELFAPLLPAERAELDRLLTLVATAGASR